MENMSLTIEEFLEGLSTEDMIEYIAMCEVLLSEDEARINQMRRTSASRWKRFVGFISGRTRRHKEAILINHHNLNKVLFEIEMILIKRINQLGVTIINLNEKVNELSEWTHDYIRRIGLKLIDIDKRIDLLEWITLIETGKTTKRNDNTEVYYKDLSTTEKILYILSDVYNLTDGSFDNFDRKHVENVFKRLNIPETIDIKEFYREIVYRREELMPLYVKEELDYDYDNCSVYGRIIDELYRFSKVETQQTKILGTTVDEENDRIQRYMDKLLNEYSLDEEADSIGTFMDIRSDLRYSHEKYLLEMDEDIRRFIEQKGDELESDNHTEQENTESKQSKEELPDKSKKVICIVYGGKVKMVSGGKTTEWSIGSFDLMALALTGYTLPADKIPSDGTLILIKGDGVKVNVPSGVDVKTISICDYYSYLYFNCKSGMISDGAKVSFLDIDRSGDYIIASGYVADSTKAVGYRKVYSDIKIKYNRTRGHIIENILGGFNLGKKDRDKISIFRAFTSASHPHLNKKLDNKDVDTVDPSWENILIGDEEKFNEKFQELLELA